SCPFTRARKSVNKTPSGAVPLALHLYRLFTSCGSLHVVVEQSTELPTVPVFISHIRHVVMSVRVPSPLSTYRGEAAAFGTQNARFFADGQAPTCPVVVS